MVSVLSSYMGGLALGADPSGRPTELRASLAALAQRLGRDPASKRAAREALVLLDAQPPGPARRMGGLRARFEHVGRATPR